MHSPIHCKFTLVSGECSAFLTCTTNGVFQKSYCKEGLHWTQETLSCGWASESKCINDPDAPSVFYKEGKATLQIFFPQLHNFLSCLLLQ